MPSVLGTNADTEVEVAYEEGRSVLASAITQMVSIVRTIINWVLRIASQIIAWAGEHPLASLLLTANICIWVS